MGLTCEWVVLWDNYISYLNIAVIRLNTEEDKLAWIWNKTFGAITGKLAYDVIAFNWNKEDNRWWHGKLWKWNIPQILKCFWWLSLKSKLLTLKIL